MNAVNVLFRVSAGEVVAVISDPNCPTFNDRGEATCYAHAGQHSTCSLGWYLGTRAATPEEYMPLYRELTQVGYSPNIRRARKHR